jgi:hypothetical protein
MIGFFAVYEIDEMHEKTIDHERVIKSACPTSWRRVVEILRDYRGSEVGAVHECVSLKVHDYMSIEWVDS